MFKLKKNSPEAHGILTCFIKEALEHGQNTKYSKEKRLVI